MGELAILGVRHHGPGSARRVVQALESLRPDCVLLEGPADCDAALPLVRHDGLRPPVALLAYRTDRAGEGLYWPFADFSPEWQAIRYAIAHGARARFVDLPAALQLGPAERAVASTPLDDEIEGPAVFRDARPPTNDPLGSLARAAGWADDEDWWEEQIEKSAGAIELFDAVHDAMGELRAEEKEIDPTEARREAHMREGIRSAFRGGAERVAVVCGAWHGPALARRSRTGTLEVAGSERSDRALLRGLPRTKIAWSWVPWSHERLLQRSGYGAGIESPGYYRHLFEHGDRAAATWLARGARLLRDADLDGSSAEVIEALRLAEALAALRDRRVPGIAELRDALLAVPCRGEVALLGVVRDRLEVGHELGEVPSELGSLPIQRDLQAQQKRLRLAPSAEPRELALDLRRPFDRDRSALLHRLALAGVAWGTELETASAGTFREAWSIEWQPELALALVDAGRQGPTVEGAAAVVAMKRARKANLPELAELLLRSVRADLPRVRAPVLDVLESRAAVSSDVLHLLGTVPPLVELARWGDARNATPGAISPIAERILARASLALPGAAGPSTPPAARALAGAIGAVAAAVRSRPMGGRELFRSALRTIAESDRAEGLVRGTALRELHALGAIRPAELAATASFALSGGASAIEAATFLEGLLGKGGLALLLDEALWTVIDDWITGLDAASFDRALPLVRRAFAAFPPAERRRMAERVRGTSGSAPTAPDLDVARAERVYPVIAMLLGNVKLAADAARASLDSRPGAFLVGSKFRSSNE